MSLLSKFKDDPLFAKVIRVSSSLFSNNTIAIGLSFVQGIIATRLLGPAGFGLVGTAMAFASTVNSIFSFRMSELVVRYGGEYLNRNEKEKAAALIKAAGLMEAAVSLIAFLIVAATASLAEIYMAKTADTAWMFTIFALGLLANFNTETSTGVLQITSRIKMQGTVILVQSILVTLVIVAAYFFNGGVIFILVAYLIGKSIFGLGMFVAAQKQLSSALGSKWWQIPFTVLTERREIVRFAFSSNISATIIKVFRESELLWLALFLDTTAVGYYRVAYILVRFLAIPADPLIASTFPEINRLAVEKAWGRLKSFLRKITAFSFAYNLVLGAGFIFFGRLGILIYSGEEYLSAYPALVALTIGLIFNYILFWNRPLLLALGKPEYPIYVTLLAGIIKLALSFWLIPQYGVVAAGGLLSFYYISSVGVMAARGLLEIKRKEGK